MNRGAWAGYSPWGHKELDTIEQLSTAYWNIVQYTVNIFGKYFKRDQWVRFSRSHTVFTFVFSRPRGKSSNSKPTNIS